MPENLGVAVSADHVRERRIAGVFDERFAFIQRIREALRRGLAVTHARPVLSEHKDKRRRPVRIRLESGRIIDVDGAAAGKDRAKSVRIEYVAKLRPMKEIRTRSVPPGHISPACRERIMLEEEMIFSFVINEPVGVVCPTDLRRKMELRTVFLIISGFAAKELVGEGEGGILFFRLSLFHDKFHVFTDPVSKVDACYEISGRQLVSFARETRFEFTFRLSVNLDTNPKLRISLIDLEEEIAFFNFDFTFVGDSSAFLIAEHNLVDVNVAPTVRFRIDDLESRFFSNEVGYVPRVPVERFASARRRIGTARVTNNLSVYDELKSRAGVSAAANKEIHVRLSNFDFRRSQFARRAVAFIVRVDKSGAAESGHLHLSFQSSFCGTRSERFAFNGPRAVI